MYSVVLTIDSVQKSDTEKKYILEARNDEGAFAYEVELSTAIESSGEIITLRDYYSHFQNCCALQIT